ncbi:YcnI family protein [Euzebya rosea]|uniref:YcnI family copper-binding membrane protein n=1 Tax=Euzebya rosea TaxID=2052804 RepID=UPI000D3E3A7D|nr:YcnI family protein [Euzebya rosea]
MTAASSTTSRRLVLLLLATVVALLSLTGPALAHVTVRTDNPTANGYGVYTVRVPTERDDASTTTIEVQIPEGLTVHSYEPVPGWEIEIGETVITISGGAIEPGQFQDFRFSARNPEEATALRFAAIQTYDSGEVVEWTGGEGADKPASMVELVAADADDAHGHSASDDDAAEDATTEDSATEDSATEDAAAEDAMTEDTTDEDTGESTDEATTAGTGSGLAVAALVVGLAGAGLGGTALARAGRS